MPASARYGRPGDNRQQRGYALLVAQSFGADPEAIEAWIGDFGPDWLRLLCRGEEIEAGLSIYPMGLYAGGRSVPLWGLAGVVLPPPRRGRGLGRELLRACLREQFESGPPLSALYPASTHLYRSLGYEHAGSRLTARLRALELPPARLELQARPVEAADWPALRQVYAAARGADTGCLDRSPAIWERVRRVPQGTLLQGALLEHQGRPEGYLLFTLARREGSLRLQMTLRDWAFTTPRARDALLHQLHVQRSVVGEITLQLGPADPLLAAVVHDQDLHVTESLAWMLRVVRVPDALQARGWPALDATVDFHLDDDELPGNAGAWRLQVAGGRARVRRIKSARARLDTRGLAALFTGRMLPPALRRAGLLQGDDRHDAALGALFAGPAPYMLDYF